MNNIIIHGRLTRDPDIRVTDSGKRVAKISVAVNRRFQRETTDFFNATGWEKVAELLENYFVKGQEIMIRGEMQSRKYTGNDGIERTAWEIRIDEIDFCGSKQDKPNPAPAGDMKPLDDDDAADLPF